MGLNCHEIEKYVFEYINEARKKEGLNTLSSDSNLKDISRAHSHEMANAGHIWHGNGVHQAGGFAGENVALMHSGRVQGFHHEIRSERDVAWALHTTWMKSPGHRENILRSGFSYVGVGVANRSSGYYATQLFKGGFSPFNLPTPVINFGLWWIVFALGIFISQLLLDYTNLSNLLLISIFTGAIIEFVSKIYQIIKFKNTFKIDKRFISWIITHSLVFYLIISLLGKLEIFYFSLIFTVVIHIIWKIEKYHEFYDFISWWATYSIGLILVNSLWNIFSLKSMMLVVLISGIIIETTSKISQILRKNAPFNIDKWFLFWVLIFSIICGLILQIPLVISLQITLLISIIITLIVYGIWKIDFYKKKVWLWIILLAILFAVVTGMPEIKNFISFINN